MLILLDTGALGLVTHPAGGDDARDCSNWLATVLKRGDRVRIPEIADYELRRELVRAKKNKSLRRLDQLATLSGIAYLPITTETMRRAADLWAAARNSGRQTAEDAALDGDMILAAQAQLLSKSGASVVVATENVGHLARFVPARSWRAI